jgi:Tfp pilus assembly protein PilX
MPIVRNKLKQRGSILGYTLLFLLIFVGLAIVSLQLADMSSLMAFRAAQKVQATALAEAGVQALYSDIRDAIATNTTVPSTYATTTMTTTIAGKATSEGSFSASVVSTRAVGGATEMVLEGVGNATNRVTSRVRASILVQANAGRMAAILSNTTIGIATNGGFRVSETVSGRNEASILANDGVAWNPTSGTKSAATNPNMLDIQGQIMVAANPDPAYAFTTGASGMGNSNGTQNYITAAYPTERIPANSIMGVPRRSFPDITQVSAWQNTWRTAAQSGTTYGALTTATVPHDPSTGEPRITAPAYINGDLTIDSGQVYLQPPANSSLSNVIYVRGNVINRTLLYNRGVKLIVEGTYTDVAPALYSLQTQYSPYTTIDALYPIAALVTLSPTSNALTMTTSSSGPAGLMYAALGGVRVLGNNEVTGTIVSGGTGTNGGVSVEPSGGNSFVVWYKPESITSRTDELQQLAGSSSSSSNTITKKLHSWVSVK